jgi:SHAQKYF class myb-like DNA-binding protein
VAASKSKKKKAPPLVTMATAPVAQPSALGDQGENTGRWTSEEHRLFLQGLDQHGKGWKKIASLIKSRTVVQIRTHAQKYFQKLSKARQNGEEGDVTMEGRGGVASVTSISSAAAAQSGKRRRPTTGTKRKAIHSVVSSAQREGKRLATAQANVGVTDPVPPLPAVAPILAYFALPYPSDVPATSSTGNCAPSIPTNQGSISGPALEDSM